MGKFFQALEQAEREHALKEEARRRATPGEAASSVPANSHGESTPAAEAPVPQPTASSEVAPAKPRFPRPTIKERPSIQAALRQNASTPHENAADLHGKVTDRLVSLLDPLSFGAEQYRSLRHKLEQLHRSSNLTVVGVSSPEPGDGKTVTTLNLAGALAQSPETRVLVIDADLRRSSLSETLGLDGSHSRGLVGAILDSQLSLNDVVEPYPQFNLSVIQTGRQPSSPYEILKSPRLVQLLHEARQQYDYVIVDMPPLVPLPDCRVIGAAVDGFLVVVSAHKTKSSLLTEGLSVLEPSSVIGLIFNGDDQKRHSYNGYYGRRPFGRGRTTGN